MAHPNIRAVFLDAGNTLFTERRPRPSIYHTVARVHGGRSDEELARDAMASAFQQLPPSFEGNFRYSLGWFEAFNHRVMEELGVSEGRRKAAHDDLLGRFQTARTYKLFPEVPEILRELQNRGIVVGVVSNWSEQLPKLLQELGIADQFDFIVASAEIKSEKPERPIFDRALFRAGVAAEETLHVGDHMDRDVRGALRAGMRAALLDRSRSDGGTLDGVPVIGDLRGILGLLEQPAAASRD